MNYVRNTGSRIPPFYMWHKVRAITAVNIVTACGLYFARSVETAETLGEVTEKTGPMCTTKVCGLGE